MKEKIHPKFYPTATVTCACGNTWTVGSTVPSIRTDVCSRCHPFFTGEQRIVDTGGQVDRFIKKLEQRSQLIARTEQEKMQASSPQLPVTELDISPRARKVLVSAGMHTVQDIITRLEQDGEESLTNLSGFGLKSLAVLKKRLRARGFTLPGDTGMEADEAESDTQEE